MTLHRGLGYVNDIQYELEEAKVKNTQQDSDITQIEQSGGSGTPKKVQYDVQSVVLDQQQTLLGVQLTILWQWQPNPPLFAVPLAQTFTPSVSGVLTKVALWWGALDCHESVTVRIENTDTNGHPTGVVLDSVVFPAPFNDGENTIVFNGTANVVAGIKYAIVLDTTELQYPGGQTILVLGASAGASDAYSNGEALIYYNNQWSTLKDSGFSDPFWAPDWNTYDYADWWFKIHIATGAVTQVDVVNNGYVKPKTALDVDAPVNSLYLSTDQDKLAYKDALGVIKPIQDAKSPLAVAHISGGLAPNDTIFWDTDTAGPPGPFTPEIGLSFKDSGGTTHIIAFA